MRVGESGERTHGRARLMAILVAVYLLCAGGRLASSPACCQTAKGDNSPGRVVNEIDDVHTGDRWILTRVPDHPAGPGRLTRVSNLRSLSAEASKGNAGVQDLRTLAASPLWVIREGDRLIVEEHSAVVEGRLDAIALGSAARGAGFKVRLKIGGKVVQAVALGPGRAVLVPESRVQP